MNDQNHGTLFPPGRDDIEFVLVGNDGHVHERTSVWMSPGEDRSDTVKATIGWALREQCGHDHYVSARRINRRDRMVLHWRVEAYCWDDDHPPVDHADMRGRLDGIVSVLRPVDDDDAERAERERMDKAVAAGAELYAAVFGSDADGTTPHVVDASGVHDGLVVRLKPWSTAGVVKATIQDALVVQDVGCDADRHDLSVRHRGAGRGWNIVIRCVVDGASKRWTRGVVVRPDSR